MKTDFRLSRQMSDRRWMESQVWGKHRAVEVLEPSGERFPSTPARVTAVRLQMGVRMAMAERFVPKSLMGWIPAACMISRVYTSRVAEELFPESF